MLRNSKVSCEGVNTASTKDRLVTNHLETIRAVDHEKDEVCDLCNVDHGIQVAIALDERYPLLLSADHCDWSLYMVKRLLRITSDQTLHQSCFPDSRWSDNSYDDRRRLVIGSSVD